VIRALLARAVARAPAAPTPAEIGRAAPRLAAAVPSGGPAHRPAARGRPLLAVAASIAVVLLVVAGALVVGRLGGPSSDTAMPGDGLGVRFVPGEVPPGFELAGIVSSPPEPPAPLPRVSVFEGDDGVTVRIASGSFGWAAGVPGGPTTTTTGPAPTAPPTSAPGTTSPPSSAPTTPESTTLPTTTTSTGPSNSSTTAPGDPGTTLGPTGSTGSTGSPGSTVPGGSPVTTVAPSLGLPQLPGLPARPGLQSVTVRGTVGALEVNDDTTSTVWFEQQGLLVVVDVMGLDRDRALGLVERLRARSDGGFDPDPADGLVSRTEIGSRGAATDPPEIAQLVYAPDGARRGPAFVVTTSPLRPGRGDLLTATAGGFGRIERWGDRQVLIDDGVDGGATTAVSFVDPAGVLVTVQGTVGIDDLRRYVDALEPIDQQAWDELVAEHPGLTVPATTAAPTTAPATPTTALATPTTGPTTTTGPTATG
jgi:hypothetical protein